MSFSKKATMGNKNTETDSGITDTPITKPKSTPSVPKVFKPTDEQLHAEKLFFSIETGIIKIGASAGSGKSSTLHYLTGKDQRPSLGLVFGKDMAEEAREKSAKNGLTHVEWKSTHSLAYHKIGMKYQHKLSRPQGRYVNVAGTGGEIARFLRIPNFHMSEDSYVSKAYVGLIVKDTVNRFETSSDKELKIQHVPKVHIKDLVKRYGNSFPEDKFVNLVFRRALDLWEERIDIYSDVLITHNTYLKLYHLSNPDLSKEFSIIYVDESQDLNPVTLDIVFKQKGKCKVVLVGDTYQSIYQFNGAVNAMDSIKGKTSHLTKSFRFGQEIANVATSILSHKMEITGNEDIKSKVSLDDSVDFEKPYTLLFRGNMELLFTAAKYISEGKDVQVYVDLKEFVAMVGSAKELYAGNLKGVKAEAILPFTKWEELLDEAKNNPELNRIAKIVEGDEAEAIIKKLKGHKNRGDAHITMLTAHKSKGLEWDQVVLARDFPSNYNQKGEWVGLSDQERNLLYVAATRAQKNLQYNLTVKEFLDTNPVNDSKDLLEKLSYGGSVQTLDQYETEMYNTGGLITPRGEQALAAVNRGIEEEFEPLATCSSGLSKNDYDTGIITASDFDPMLECIMKDIQ